MVEASAGPSDAVLALAGMSLARDTGDIVPASNLGVIASPAVDTTSSGGKKQGAGTSAPAEAPPTGDAFGASKRHAMTLGAMQAQFASGGERLPGAKPQKEVAAGGSGVRAGGNNAELEKVSAFISSYAGTLSFLQFLSFATGCLADFFRHRSVLGRPVYTTINTNTSSTRIATKLFVLSSCRRAHVVAHIFSGVVII